MSTADQPRPVTAASLDDMGAAGIRHGFFTRDGGVSEGIYRGLNVGLGSNDDPEKVQQEWAYTAEHLQLPTPPQIDLEALKGAGAAPAGAPVKNVPDIAL